MGRQGVDRGNCAGLMLEVKNSFRSQVCVYIGHIGRPGKNKDTSHVLPT